MEMVGPCFLMRGSPLRGCSNYSVLLVQSISKQIHIGVSVKHHREQNAIEVDALNPLTL